MSFARTERRIEAAKRRLRIDRLCPADLVREIDVTLASAIVGKQFAVGETIGDVAKRECPQLFDVVTARGFVLSFALPENTTEALARGVIAYAVKRPLH